MGPLAGVRIVEMGGMGPGPFCAMLLADLGADVIRIERKAGGAIANFKGARFDLNKRGRPAVALDLKSPEGRDVALALIEKADALIEGFRPGVMERLGLGPDVALHRNPRLVYGRVTGWGQDGPLADTAAHDLNYVALTGALHSMGPGGQRPSLPLNLVGDFAGGSMFLAIGLLSALLEARTSGKGQVVDAAIVDGVALLMTENYGMDASGFWSEERGTNVSDGGAPFFNTYETSDGKFVSIGPVEPQFYACLRELLALSDPLFDSQWDREKWPEMRTRLDAVFRARTQQEWTEFLEGTDACFAPVLSVREAPKHRHNAARRTFIELDGILQPAPGPRFSRTKPDLPATAAAAQADCRSKLEAWGLAPAQVEFATD